MKKYWITGLFITLVLSIIRLLPTPDDQQVPTSSSVKFINVDYFDGQHWHAKAELSVVDGRIVDGRITNQASASIKTIDMQGKFLVPGLIDAHTHTWGNALQQALDLGVTTELDMFTDYRFARQQAWIRDTLQNKKTADLFSAGTLVTSEGGHGTQFTITIPTLNNVEDTPGFIQQRVDEGSDYIKIVYNHEAQYGPYTSLSLDVLAEAIRQAHKHDKLAAVHISNYQSAKDAVEAGADGLVHTFGDKLVSDALLERMKHQDVFVIPTLSVIASMAKSHHSRQLAQSPLFDDKLSSGTKNALENVMDVRYGSSQMLQTAIENTRKMHQAGITVLAGTDAPNPGTAHGASLHGELILLVESGLTPTEAISAATYKIHKSFPVGQRGHLKPGARADILVLNANPGDDIRNTQDINSIYKNGYLVPDQKEFELSLDNISFNP